MAPPTDDGMRPGMRTSEFALAVACIGVVLFQDKLGIVLDQTVERILAAGPLVYIGGRNIAKIAAVLSGIFGVKIPASLLEPQPNGGRREPTPPV
jgi:hypothetical protein